MNDASYARVKEIFLKAVDLPKEQRNAFLEQACNGDVDLQKEVMSLLDNHMEDTFVVGSVPHAKVSASPELTSSKPKTRMEGKHFGPNQKLGHTSVDIKTRFIQNRFFGTKARFNLSLFGVAVLLILLGVWTYRHVKGALEDIRSQQLETILKSDVMALEIWVDQQKADARALAGDRRVNKLISKLIERHGFGELADKETIVASPSHQELNELLMGYLKETQAAAYFLVDRTGFIISHTYQEPIGHYIKEKGAAFADKVFNKGPQFSTPFPIYWGDEVAEEDKNRMVCWTAVPVTDHSGKVIAALGFATFADERFSDILHVARMGETGETYAFDADGVMVSESRYNDQLRQIGLLHDTLNFSMTNVQLRDPGGNLLEGYVLNEPLAARPFTKTVAMALAANANNDTITSGVQIEEYRDYRGVKVIGAWNWMPSLNMGVITEVDVEEAFAPLIYLNIAFLILFSLLNIFVGYAMFSSFSLVRLRKKVGEAMQLGQYTLLHEIGEGGMGKVFLATHAMLKRPTAVKMLKKDMVSEDTVKRFEREVQVVSKLTHPNTIAVYDFGRTSEGIFYYAMEFLQGCTLIDVVRIEGFVSPERTVHFLKQICGSLKEAHDMNLAHRDIKPQNIMLCKRGGQYDVVKVLDFGLVKDIEQGEDLELTRHAKISGTPLYMAPERFRNPGQIDLRSDIYSIGAVAYFLLTGKKVFDHINELNMLHNILNEDPKPLAEVIPNTIPVALESLVQSCLAKDPNDRPQSMAAILAVLETLVFEQPWTTSRAGVWWEKNFEEFK